ncbi:MAG: SanA/YdcF family protein [Flavobacteriales bacterium]
MKISLLTFFTQTSSGLGEVLRMLKKNKILLLLLFSFALFSNYYIKKNAIGKLFSEIKKTPKNRVGLVLGTGKYANGKISPYYLNRIEATVELFKAGKIDLVLVSGDNSHKNYNEPNYFKGDLIKKGIPEDKIVLDYAGFRTLDSIIRAKKVFGLQEFTIISQKFHNERAIYLAEEKGLSVIAFNAKDVKGSLKHRNTIREYFAKTKATLDIIFNTKSKFLGKKIQL